MKVFSSAQSTEACSGGSGCRTPPRQATFFGKMRIVAELERLGPMRLKFVGRPNALHHCGRRAQRFGQGSRAPMRRVAWLFLSGFRYDGASKSRSCFGRPSAARRVFFDTGQPPLGKRMHRKRNRFASGLQRFGDVLVHHSIRREQDDFGSQHQTCRRPSSASPAIERFSFRHPLSVICGECFMGFILRIRIEARNRQ